MDELDHLPPAHATIREPAPDQHRPAPDDVGPVEAVNLLLDEARDALTQEALQLKAVAAAGAYTGRSVTVYAIAAILVALVAIMTLAIGAMLSLAAVVGFGAATAIVVSVLLFAGAILVLLIKREVARFKRALTGEAS